MRKYTTPPVISYKKRHVTLPKNFFLCFFLSCFFYVKMNKQIIIFIYYSISYHFCYKINTMWYIVLIYNIVIFNRYYLLILIKLKKAVHIATAVIYSNLIYF